MNQLYFDTAAIAKEHFLQTKPKEKENPAKTSPETPMKVRELKRVVRDADFSSALDKKTTNVVEEGIKEIRKLPDTPNKRQRSRHSRETFDVLATNLSGTNRADNLVLFHTMAHPAAESSPFLRRLVRTLVDVDGLAQHKALHLSPPIEIINLNHLIKADRRGFHLCLPGDAMWGKLTGYKYGANGVYQANFQMDGMSKPKMSSFFPLEGIEELEQILQDLLHRNAFPLQIYTYSLDKILDILQQAEEMQVQNVDMLADILQLPEEEKAEKSEDLSLILHLAEKRGQIVGKLVEILQSHESRTHTGNRHLCSIPGVPYHIEMYKVGGHIKSAFPILYFGEWDSVQTAYSFYESAPSIPSHEVLSRAKKAIEAYSQPFLGAPPRNPIRHTIDAGLVLELGTLFPELGVPQGIFMQFPRDLFYDVVDADILDEIALEE